jgi:phospholipase C
MATSRRDFLKAAALLAGGAGVGGVVPESVKRAFAIEPAPGSTYRDAEHVVILMQENRSFDHALGSLQGVRGFNDPRAIRQANGNSVFAQTDAAGKTFVPWRLDIKDTKITWMGSIPHSRQSQVDAWNEGHYDQWIDAKRSHVAEYKDVPITMGHYMREDLPFYYALADAFTVCDQSFCSAMTSTTPNRSFFWTGTVRDEQKTDSRVFMRNNEIAVGGQTWKTFPERLQDAGVSWKFYQNELSHNTGFTDEQEAWLGNFGLNIMEWFAAYNIAAYPYAPGNIQHDLDRVNERLPKTREALENAQDPEVRAKLQQKIKADELERAGLMKQLANGTGKELYAKMTPAERALHDVAFVTNVGDPDYRSLEPLAFEGGTMNVPKGDVLYQFREDVKNGKLPTVSWLGSAEHFSDHPTSPWYGAWYVSEVMDILTQNPEVWKKTIFILTYDENDGYFDHVPSYAAADPKRAWTGRASEGIGTGLDYTYAEDELRQGVSQEEARTGPIGMGFRVPTIVASPWSRGGWVNSQLFDHTSTLQFLEDFVAAKTGKQVRETNISAWRRTITGDLTSCFRPHTEKEAKLEYLNRDKFVIQIREAKDKEVPSNYVNLNAEQIADVNEKLAASQYMSKQEPGTRPANALPYELYADGGVSADGSRFELVMTAGDAVHGAKSVGAPFNVYARRTKDGKPEMVAGTYAVKAGDTMTQGFPLAWFPGGAYEIEVHGPNGFYRRFVGEAGSPLGLKAVYERRGRRLSGNVRLALKNAGSKPMQVAVTDHSYGEKPVMRTVGAGESAEVVLPLGASHGWYDFSVSAEGETAGRRYAGRVETGEVSVTDPLMGRVV